MNFIIELVELVITFFRVLFAVPVFGPLLLFGTLGLIIMKAVRRR